MVPCLTASHFPLPPMPQDLKQLPASEPEFITIKHHTATTHVHFCFSIDILPCDLRDVSQAGNS